MTLDWEGAFNDAAPNHACPTSEDISPCHLHEGSGLRVLVLGDSEVWSFTPTLRELAAEEDWDLWEGASGGCPWEYGLQHESLIGDAEALADGCAEMQERWWTQFVAAVDPDLVVGIRAPREDPVAHVSARLDGGDWIGWTYSSDSEYWDTIETAIDRSVAALRGEGRRLLILEPFPITGPFATPDPRQCLSDVRTVADLDDCAYPASAPNLPIEVLYRAAAESDPGVRTLDLDRFFCPDGETCPAAIDGVVVRRDWLHPTASFVDLHRDVLRDAINAAGDAPG